MRERPIAVMDSGVGGISVLKELLRVMPNEDYIYLGDSANAPYGTRTKEEILSLTRGHLADFRKRGIKAFVIACNTATSAAAEVLRAENPDLPIIGIEPAIKPAAFLLQNPRVLVMATPLTLREEKFRSLVARFSDREEILPLPCPGLVELIESGDFDGQEMHAYLEKLFQPYRGEKMDALVLGCTHYPHIRQVIASHLPPSTLILDGGEGTARETKRRLEVAGLLRETSGRGEIEIINTAGEPRLEALSWALLNRNENT